MQNEKMAILYVDDEALNLKLFDFTFKREFEVFTAVSGEEALKVLDEQGERIQVLITDQVMPTMTGVDLLKIVSEKYPHIPPSRLIVSGFSETEVIQEAYKKYALFKFISKPWRKEELRRTIYDSIKKAG